jgi:hypothetical protein
MLDDPSLSLYDRAHIHLLMATEVTCRDYPIHARNALAFFESLLKHEIETDGHMVATLKERVNSARDAVVWAEKALQKEREECRREIDNGGVDAEKLTQRLRMLQLRNDAKETENAIENEQADTEKAGNTGRPRSKETENTAENEQVGAEKVGVERNGGPGWSEENEDCTDLGRPRDWLDEALESCRLVIRERNYGPPGSEEKDPKDWIDLGRPRDWLDEALETCRRRIRERNVSAALPQRSDWIHYSVQAYKMALGSDCIC